MSRHQSAGGTVQDATGGGGRCAAAYLTPLLRPDTSADVVVAGTSTSLPPGTARTVYFATAAPLSDSGACQVTRAHASPASTFTSRTGPGSPAGDTGALGCDGSDSARALQATTVTVTGSPLARPSTRVLRSVAATDSVRPDGDSVSLYVVSGLPPLVLGAFHRTTIAPSCGVALTSTGGEGGPMGTTGGDMSDGRLEPALLVAVTTNWCCTPLMRPVTTVRVTLPLTVTTSSDGSIGHDTWYLRSPPPPPPPRSNAGQDGAGAGSGAEATVQSPARSTPAGTGTHD